MENLVELKINRFELSYDGLFKLRFTYNGRNFEKYVCLEPEHFLKILRTEGYTTAESTDALKYEWIPFERAEIIVSAFLKSDGSIDGFRTSEIAADWLDKGICMIDVQA